MEQQIECTFFTWQFNVDS